MKYRFIFPYVFLVMAGGLSAQTQPGQVVASIPAENSPVSVANGDHNKVNLIIGDTTYPLDAEEAQRLAEWIKEANPGTSMRTGTIIMKREKNSFLLMPPANTEADPVELKKEWAYQLAQALAAGRMNVSEAGKP
jgi:hypothetical protein